jgi:hypothetical protein
MKIKEEEFKRQWMKSSEKEGREKIKAEKKKRKRTLKIEGGKADWLCQR